MSGMESMGYSTSTTGPITRATRPVAPPEPVSLVSSTVAVMVFSSVSRLARYWDSAWASASAFTPPTISLISWVMPA